MSWQETPKQTPSLDDSDESDVGEDDEGDELTEKIKRRKSVSEYEHDFKVWSLQVVNSKENNLNYLALYVCIGSTSNYGELRLSFQMKWWNMY